ncbi:MAG: 50S ribosomal protein L9 [Elusimicrobiota bacterium]
MKVILQSDVQNIGRRGDIKDVSAGYARNFLLPQKLALEANDQNMKLLEREKNKIARQLEQEVAAARELAQNMEKASFTVNAKAGEGGKLFGSVTNTDVAKALEEKGFSFDKHNITLPDHIKEVGVFHADVKVHQDVTAKIKIWVVEEKE